MAVRLPGRATGSKQNDKMMNVPFSSCLPDPASVQDGVPDAALGGQGHPRHGGEGTRPGGRRQTTEINVPFSSRRNPIHDQTTWRFSVSAGRDRALAVHGFHQISVVTRYRTAL